MVLQLNSKGKRTSNFCDRKPDVVQLVLGVRLCDVCELGSAGSVMEGLKGQKSALGIKFPLWAPETSCSSFCYRCSRGAPVLCGGKGWLVCCDGPGGPSWAAPGYEEPGEFG